MKTYKMLFVFFIFNFFAACAMKENVNIPKPKRELTNLENLFIGTTAGIAEVIVDQPLVYFKNMIQQGKKISHYPRVWYRGGFVNAASLAPTTAVQSAVYAKILKSFPNDKQGNLSSKVLAAFSGGALSAFVSSPSELLIIWQQNSGKNFYQTFELVTRNKDFGKSFVKGVLTSIHDNLLLKDFFSKNPGFMEKFKSFISNKVSDIDLSRDKSYYQQFNFKGLNNLSVGFVPTAIRDGGFSASLFGLSPVLKEKIESFTNDQFDLKAPKWAIGLGGGISAGLIAAILTHPFDTVKTEMQSNLDNPKSFSRIFFGYLKDGEFKLLYKGFVPRATRVASAITIMSSLTEYLQNRFKK